MKVFAVFVAVLVASATALDTAEFTWANKKLQKFKDAVAAQVSTSAGNIASAIWDEFFYLQDLQSYSMNFINAVGNAQLTADYNALTNSIVAKLAAKFYPDNVAQAILAPYIAVASSWYAKVSADIASENTATPLVKLACLKLEEALINSNITDLSGRITNKVNQQLSAINPRFNAMNIQINAYLAGVDMNIADTCGNDMACAAGVYEASLPGISATVDGYIQQNVDAFASDVTTAGTKAAELDAIFVKRYTWIGQDLAKCQAASA